MEEKNKKDYPPGWNDPPMLNYSSSNPLPKSRLSNKRVAFPLSPSTSQGDPKTSDAKLQNQCLKDLYAEGHSNFTKLLESAGDEKLKLNISQLLNDWETNKFSEHLQSLLTDFTKYLLENNESKIKEIHLKLMMENSSDLKKYFSSLDQLINLSK